MDDMPPLSADPDGRARVPRSAGRSGHLRGLGRRHPWVHPLMAELLAHRRAKRITAAELSRRSGYSINTINHYSCGRGRPSAQLLADLANAIGLELRLVPVDGDW